MSAGSNFFQQLLNERGYRRAIEISTSNYGVGTYRTSITKHLHLSEVVSTPTWRTSENNASVHTEHQGKKPLPQSEVVRMVVL